MLTMRTIVAGLLASCMTASAIAVIATSPAAATGSTSLAAVHVDAGSTAAGTAGGLTWAPDRGYVGGSVSKRTPVTGTTASGVYGSIRFGMSGYNLQMRDGAYDVTLRMAETYHSSKGKRLFDVKLEDTSVLSKFDVFAAAGGKFKAVDRTFRVTVKGGNLDVDYTARVDKPLVSAISVTPVPTTASPTPVPTTASPTTPAPIAGRLVFDADVARKGLAAYSSTHNANRVSIVNDPVLGDTRKVLRFTVYDTDDQLTGNPRAQLETSKFWGKGDEYYVGASYYFPRDFPMQQDTKQWVNLGEVYGAPYAGASPNSLFVKRVSNGTQVIAWQRNGNYGWDRPFEVPLVKGRWHDFVLRIKLSDDPTVGYTEAWSNTGGGWQQLKLNGQNRLHGKTMDASNSGGLNYHKIAHYRSKGMWPVATHYTADHKIGTSFEAVAPRSYS